MNRRTTSSDLPGETMNRDARQVLTEWLVLAARAGDETAFRELHALWRVDVRRLAMARVERREFAEEIVQDAWIDIARGLPRLEDPACFPRWALRIVERRCVDWIRRRQRDRQRATQAAASAELLAPMPAPSTTELPDDVVRLRAAIAQLPPDERELLHLYYELGRSVAEIAEILDRPPGTVKSRLFSVRESLRQALERIPS
jgi:RNA polymerase sigma-70 factor, ECF subfamily